MRRTIPHSPKIALFVAHLCEDAAFTDSVIWNDKAVVTVIIMSDKVIWLKLTDKDWRRINFYLNINCYWLRLFNHHN